MFDTTTLLIGELLYFALTNGVKMLYYINMEEILEQNKDNNIEQNIATNIKTLRQQFGLKQSELGEKIAYSDKTVSKWENGTSVPDISALYALAEVFGLKVDDLIKPDAAEKSVMLTKQEVKENHANEIAMLCLSVLSVWMVATFVYFAVWLIRGISIWQLFVWAICPSALILYRFNRINSNVKWVNTLTLSIFLWSLIVALYLQLLKFHLWPLFFLGVPTQAMIVISTLFRKRKKRE